MRRHRQNGFDPVICMSTFLGEQTTSARGFRAFRDRTTLCVWTGTTLLHNVAANIDADEDLVRYVLDIPGMLDIPDAQHPITHGGTIFKRDPGERGTKEEEGGSEF